MSMMLVKNMDGLQLIKTLFNILFHFLICLQHSWKNPYGSGPPTKISLFAQGMELARARIRKTLMTTEFIQLTKGKRLKVKS